MSASELVYRIRESSGRDELRAVIGFSETARELDPEGMADLEWDFIYGSNLAAALDQAREALSGEPGRVVVFTDLEATAHTNEAGEHVFCYPPVAETLDKTLEAIGHYSHADLRLDVRRVNTGETPDANAMTDTLIRAICDVGGSVEDVSVPPCYT